MRTTAEVSQGQSVIGCQNRTCTWDRQIFSAEPNHLDHVVSISIISRYNNIYFTSSVQHSTLKRIKTLKFSPTC